MRAMTSDRAGDDPAAWLAAATDSDPTEVAAELDEGARRRAFVVDELLEAGYRDGELLELVQRLTGLDDGQARALIAAREPLAESPQSPTRPRDRRLAENEVLFRRANDEAARRTRTSSLPAELEVVCECADRDCHQTLTMPMAEYEWLRQNRWRFVVLPGHEAPAVEEVVERFDGYVVVEKHPETRRQVEAD
jgi:hypothetical protein